MSDKRGATYEELLALPDHKVAEIVEGDLFASPRPRIRHARAGAALTGALYDAFDRGASGPGGWWILYEPELHLGNDVLVPDIAAWNRDRLPALPDEPASPSLPTGSAKSSRLPPSSSTASEKAPPTPVTT